METQKERRSRLSKERYLNDLVFREKVKAMAKAKYANDENYKKKVKARAKAAKRELAATINQKRRDDYRKKAEEAGRTVRKTHAIIIGETKRERQTRLQKERRNNDPFKKERAKARSEKLRERRINDPVYKAIENAKRREYLKNNHKVTPLAKAKSNMRRRFRTALKRNNQSKSNKISTMIGCTWPFFYGWITSQFTKEMNWKNYGTVWHIDHITPLSFFDVCNQAHIKQAWHYTNLRPLEAEANIRKGANIITHQPELVIALV